jgi:hypothetical protein
MQFLHGGVLRGPYKKLFVHESNNTNKIDNVDKVMGVNNGLI